MNINRKRPFLMLAMLFMVISTSALGYVYNGFYVRTPNCIKVQLTPNATRYSEFTRFVEWNYPTSPLGFMITEDTTDSDIRIIKFEYADGDIYGKCIHHTDTRSTLYFYEKWEDLDWTKRVEVVNHEIGHSIGLAHCQSDKVSISIMREYGFCNSVGPLTDDVTGINNKY
ncbi:MAG: matrixin family metalloprotease [Tissierellia bacterium]|nr:matrixin family metalloprotease [Tissierellia bacterium]